MDNHDRLILTTRFTEAVEYAREIHQGTRKGSRVPYMAHLLGVTALVMGENGNVPFPVSEDLALAALLHDAVEDEGGLPRLWDIETRFGVGVAEIVKGCTDSFETDSCNKKDWKTRKTAYIERLRSETGGTLLVSVADKLYNAQATLADFNDLGQEVWERFKRGRDEQLWYFEELIKVYDASCGGWRIVHELKRVVNELRTVSRF
jgi:(p)ppGpp synthase/HD superfamily hydrolase